LVIFPLARKVRAFNLEHDGLPAVHPGGPDEGQNAQHRMVEERRDKSFGQCALGIHCFFGHFRDGLDAQTAPYGEWNSRHGSLPAMGPGVSRQVIE